MITRERLLAIEALSRDHLEIEGSQETSANQKAAIRELLEEVLRLGEQLDRRQYIWDLADETFVRSSLWRRPGGAIAPSILGKGR